MKKSSIELKQELQEVQTELNYLYEKYPLYYKRHGIYCRSPLPIEILKEYGILMARKNNLKTNINQMIWREFGMDARDKRLQWEVRRYSE